MILVPLLVEQTLEERIVPDVPERLIGDKAYDSDGLDKNLMANFGRAECWRGDSLRCSLDNWMESGCAFALSLSLYVCFAVRMPKSWRWICRIPGPAPGRLTVATVQVEWSRKLC